MKKLIFNLLSGIALMVFNAQANGQERPTKPDELYKIPGTRYALVLPNRAFKKQSYGIVIKNEQTGSGIAVVTEVPSPFDSSAALFLNEKQFRNDTILSKSDYIENGYKLRILKLQKREISASNGLQNTKQLQWMMVYGNDSLSVFLGAFCKDSAGSEKDEIERSLRSFVYLNDGPIDISDALDFTVNTKNTGLFLADIVWQNGALYNSSKQPFGSSANDSITVMILPMPVPGDWENRKELLQRKIDLASMADSLKLIDQRDWTINGMQAFEAITSSQKKGVVWVNYETRIYLKEKHYLIQGSSSKDIEKSILIFRKLAASFKLK